MVEPAANASIVETDIIDLIEKGYNIIGPSTKEEGYIVLGDSRAGKTTFCCFLAGYDLLPQKEKGLTSLVLNKPEQFPELKISSKKLSETKTPVKIKNEKYVIFDTPGFFDSNKKQELANAFYIQRIFEILNGLKLILVVPEAYFLGSGSQFIKCVEHFAKMFTLEIGKLETCLTLVVSMATRTKEDIQEEIKEIIESYDSSKNEKVVKLMLILSKSIEIFPVPPFPDNYKGDIFHSLEKNTVFLYEKNFINVVISEQCKSELVKDLFKQRSNDLINSLKKIAEKIESISNGIIQTKKTINKPAKGFFRSITSITSITSYFFSKSTTNNQPLQKIFGLNTFLIFSDFFRTVLNPNLSTQDFIKSFEKQIDKLFEGFGQFSDESPKDLNILCIEVKQRVKHMEFLDKVYKGEDEKNENIWKELSPYLDLFNSAQTALMQAQTQGIDSFELDMTISAREFYSEAIEIMSEYQRAFNKDCKVQISRGYYRLGLIDKNLNNEQSIQECLLSLDNCNTNNDVFELINEICEGSPTLLGFISNKNFIVEKLFIINDEAMNNRIRKLNSEIKSCVENTLYEIPFLNLIEELMLKQKELDKIKNSDDLPFLEEILNFMYQKLNKNNENGIFFSYLKEIFKITNQNKPEKANDSLKIWVKNLQEINIENQLFLKIKTFNVEKMFEIDKDIKNYTKLIAFTQSKIILSNEGIALADDPAVKNVKTATYDFLGDLFLQNNQYDEALNNCLYALEDEEDRASVLRKIDDIYFKKEKENKNSFDFNRLSNKIKMVLFDFNLNEFCNMFSKRVFDILEQFKKQENKFFDFNKNPKEWSMIIYLNDLNKIFEFCNKLYREKNFSYLFDLNNILEYYFKREELDKYLESIKISICDKNLVNWKTALKIEGIINQFDYLKKLSDGNNLENCFENKETKKPFLGENEENKKFFEDNVAKFPLIQDFPSEKYEEYYLDTLKLTSQFEKNINCMLLSSLACFEIAKRKQSDIFYVEAQKYDTKLRDLCLDNDNLKVFYTKNSKIREIYQSFADLYEKEGNFFKCIEYLELRGNHLKLEKILKKILKEHEECPKFLLKLGDYYKKIDRSDKAIKYYKYAAGLIYDTQTLSLINKNIHEILASFGKEGMKTLYYKSMSELLENKVSFEMIEEPIFKDFSI